MLDGTLWPNFRYLISVETVLKSVAKSIADINGTNERSREKHVFVFRVQNIIHSDILEKNTLRIFI